MICLRPQIFQDLPHVKAGFFGRQGGVSQGVFASLNCGPGSGDDRDAVAMNRQKIADYLGISDVNGLYQIHSNICVVQNEKPEKLFEADASVTTEKNFPLGILTADCGPILFYADGSEGSVVAAAHAGWGGAVKGILESTTQKMLECGARLESIRVAIGPCIGWESYEVSRGFEIPFLQEDEGAHIFFREKGDKLKFHLAGYIAFRLRRLGITQIEDVAVDTYADPEKWFSYRRATHEKQAQYGRQISVIALT